MFNDIKDNNYYDVSLVLEWDTWCAVTISNSGEIKLNLKSYGNGQPIAIAFEIQQILYTTIAI